MSWSLTIEIWILSKVSFHLRTNLKQLQQFLGLTSYFVTKWTWSCWKDQWWYFLQWTIDGPGNKTHHLYLNDVTLPEDTKLAKKIIAKATLYAIFDDILYYIGPTQKEDSMSCSATTDASKDFAGISWWTFSRSLLRNYVGFTKL